MNELKNHANLISSILELIMALCLIGLSVGVARNGGATVYQYIAMAINCAIWLFISSMYRRTMMKNKK